MTTTNIVAAFRGLPMSPEKHSYMRDYQESVTTGQTHTQTDARQSDLYVPLCFAGDTIKRNCIPVFFFRWTMSMSDSFSDLIPGELSYALLLHLIRQKNDLRAPEHRWVGRWGNSVFTGIIADNKENLSILVHCKSLLTPPQLFKASHSNVSILFRLLFSVKNMIT